LPTNERTAAAGAAAAAQAQAQANAAHLSDKDAETEDDDSDNVKPRGRAARPTSQPRLAVTSQGKHGRRINPRKGIPMHIMATYALLRLPEREGNLSDMASKIEENQFFSKQLDWTPRPGTKTYPRYACTPTCQHFRRALLNS
jgi:hypothetical protein